MMLSELIGLAVLAKVTKKKQRGSALAKRLTSAAAAFQRTFSSAGMPQAKRQRRRRLTGLGDDAPLPGAPDFIGPMQPSDTGWQSALDTYAQSLTSGEGPLITRQDIAMYGTIGNTFSGMLSAASSPDQNFALPASVISPTQMLDTWTSMAQFGTPLSSEINKAEVWFQESVEPAAQNAMTVIPKANLFRDLDPLDPQDAGIQLMRVIYDAVDSINAEGLGTVGRYVKIDAFRRAMVAATQSLGFQSGVTYPALKGLLGGLEGL